MSDMPGITPAQVRAARAFLDCSRVDLARSAGVSVATIKRFEEGFHPVPDDVIRRIQEALESEGVQFLADDGDGPGARLKRGAVHTSPRGV